MRTLLQQEPLTTVVARLAAALLVVVGALVSGACEGAPARSKPWRHARPPVVEAEPSTVAERAQRRDIEARRERANTLTIHSNEPLTRLNPLSAPTVAGRRVTLDTVFETLIRYRAGTGPRAGSLEPGLAASFNLAPSGREIRLVLDPEARFADGSKVSTVDVQFSLDAARRPRVGADQLRRLLADVDGVDIVNSKTVRVRLGRKNGYVLRALAEVPILKESVYRSGLTAARFGQWVGSGPYRPTEVSDDRVVLVRRDDYWGPAPKLERIVFVHEPDAARALTAAKRGEFDIVPELIAQHVRDQPSAPGIASEFDVLRLGPAALQYMVMDVRRPPFDDPRVRRAVSLLVERRTVIDEGVDGLARAVATPVWPGGPGDAEAAPVPGFDREQAARLLDEAGWRDSGDGQRRRNGERLRASLLALPGPGAVRDPIVKQLRAAGFYVEVRKGPDAVLLNRLRAGDFGLAFMEVRTNVDVDLSPLFETGGALNFGRFSSPDVDALLARARAAPTATERRPAVRELGAAIARAQPVIGLFSPTPVGLVHRRVTGLSAADGWVRLRDLALRE